MAYIKFRKKNIFFTDEGKGKTVILLHGFTESSKIWTGFASKLSEKFRVICIDLPGHGKSECIDTIHSMELMAEVVMTVMTKLKTGKAIMVGHSMGGYVTLAFAGKYPSKLRGLCLFHSHCYADSPEEKENRNRTIDIVGKDKLSFLAQFIPGLFPVEVHKTYAGKIEKLIHQASKMHKEGVIAALEGMKNRQDQSELLKKTGIPVLFIVGLRDAKAPLSRLLEMFSLPVRSEILLLRDCGHMGYIEAPEETLRAVMNFTKGYL